MDLIKIEGLERGHFTAMWILWVVMFFLIEGLAVITDGPSRATLSSHVRDFMRVAPWRQYVGWLVMITLTLHFLWDLNE